jgi:hypothetical protein
MGEEQSGSGPGVGPRPCPTRARFRENDSQPGHPHRFSRKDRLKTGGGSCRTGPLDGNRHRRFAPHLGVGRRARHGERQAGQRQPDPAGEARGGISHEAST